VHANGSLVAVIVSLVGVSGANGGVIVARRRSASPETATRKHSVIPAAHGRHRTLVPSDDARLLRYHQAVIDYATLTLFLKGGHCLTIAYPPARFQLSHSHVISASV